jgi:hypothetical protein
VQELAAVQARENREGTIESEFPTGPRLPPVSMQFLERGGDQARFRLAQYRKLRAVRSFSPLSQATSSRDTSSATPN